MSLQPKCLQSHHRQAGRITTRFHLITKRSKPATTLELGLTTSLKTFLLEKQESVCRLKGTLSSLLLMVVSQTNITTLNSFPDSLPRLGIIYFWVLFSPHKGPLSWTLEQQGATIPLIPLQGNKYSLCCPRAFALNWALQQAKLTSRNPAGCCNKTWNHRCQLYFASIFSSRIAYELCFLQPRHKASIQTAVQDWLPPLLDSPTRLAGDSLPTAPRDRNSRTQTPLITTYKFILPATGHAWEPYHGRMYSASASHAHTPAKHHAIVSLSSF